MDDLSDDWQFMKTHYVTVRFVPLDSTDDPTESTYTVLAGDIKAAIFEAGHYLPLLGDGRTCAQVVSVHTDGSDAFMARRADPRRSDWGEIGRYMIGEDGRPVVDIVTCGQCGQSWNDALITSRTPAPSARCPFE